jgi:FkbM family methyltransferase
MVVSAPAFTIRCDAVIGGLRRAVVREVKRGLCLRGFGEFTFDVEQFGAYRFRCGNAIEYHRTLQFGGEAEALGAFLFQLRPDDVVWDVGASVGVFSVHAAGTARRVVAFEPDPATFHRLQQNVLLNGFGAKIDCRMEAVGDKAGPIGLRTDGLAGAAPSVADLGRHSGAVDAVMTTIDALVERGLPPPTVLKIDIEGAEILALRGARALLASSSAPRVLFVEAHPAFLPAFGSTLGDVEGFVESDRYRLAVRRQRGDQIHLLAIRR